jgi:flagellar biosynthesis/type III secretory pathway ATPase
MMTALLDALAEPALSAARPRRYGQVTQMVGMSIEVAGLPAAIGDGLLLLPGEDQILAEVVALRDERVVCLALGETAGLRAGTRVIGMGGPLPVRVGPALLGRVLDGIGRPLDEGSPIEGYDVSVAGARGAGARRSHSVREGPAAGHLRRLGGREVVADVDDRPGDGRRRLGGGADRRTRS